MRPGGARDAAVSLNDGSLSKGHFSPDPLDRCCVSNHDDERKRPVGRLPIWASQTTATIVVGLGSAIRRPTRKCNSKSGLTRGRGWMSRMRIRCRIQTEALAPRHERAASRRAAPRRPRSGVLEGCSLAVESQSLFDHGHRHVPTELRAFIMARAPKTIKGRRSSRIHFEAPRPIAEFTS